MKAEKETLRIDAGGTAMVVDRWGSARGTPILALHGIPGWRGTWTKVARAVAPHRSVFVPDLPGFGESGDAPPGAHAPEYASAVLAAMDALEVEAVHLVGHDFGGPIALMLAARAPSRVRSVTLLSTNAFGDTPVPLPLRIARVPIAGDVAFRAFFGRVGLTLTWAVAVGDKRAFPFRDYRRALAYANGVASTRRIFLASLRDLARLYVPVEAALRSLTVPAQVLWGDRDPFFPVAVGERTAREIPHHTPIHVLQGAGHFLPEERATEVASRIRAIAER
jgi:pimeloyl-ACP methyl ester carboxylesterase